MLESNPTSTIERLLTTPPYSIPQLLKTPLFLAALAECYHHHFINCAGYRRYCERRGFLVDTQFNSLADFPFLPAQAFKESAELLTSVQPEHVRTKLQSSATSGIPSTVAVDRITARRQIRALTSVVAEVLGRRRRRVLVMDIDPHLSRGLALGARAAAVQGFLNLAREAEYFMGVDDKGQLSLNPELLVESLARCAEQGEPVVVLGFTYVLHRDVALPLLARGDLAALPPGSHVVHIGGWKKLEEQRVSKEQFNETMSRAFGVPPSSVIDFYGFTEQMGVTYPDGPEGLKHAPIFADVIVRDPSTLQPVPDGEIGMLQFLTPLPHSYPGFSVLTDDLGVIVSRDCSKNGWNGTQFRVIGRAAKAEVRGCGDIMGEKVVRSTARPGVSDVARVDAEARLLFDGIGRYVPDSLEESVRLAELPSVADLTALAERLRQARRRLDSYSVDELIALVDAAARRWLEPNSPLAGMLHQGLLFLANWCQATALHGIADRSLSGRRGYLDGFRPAGDTNARLMRAVPRGLAVHWLAGNVPLLGMLTLVQSIVCRNANLLKSASTFSSVLPLLLDAFRGLRVRTAAGRWLSGDDILASIAVVYFPRQNTSAAEAISAAADVRLAWGGREAVDAVTSLPKQYDAEDIVFGPKFSYMAIGREYLAAPQLVRKLARRAATDASVFDQYACASPHTVFVEKDGGAASPREFASILAEEMGRAAIRIPKSPTDAGTAAQISRRRLQYEFTADLWTSPGTEWTVLFDEDWQAGLAEACYSRVVTVRAIDDIMDCAAFANPGIQTVGLALDGPRKLAFAEAAASRGAARFPDVGRMTFFDAPWDGLLPMQRMVRWVTLGGPY